MKRKIVFIAIFLISVSSFAYSDTVWEGTAAISRFGEFPPSGFYGASNSFPINTIVTVENTLNGETVDVIITSKLGKENIFILLSSDASKVLIINENELIPVIVKHSKKIFTPDETDEIEEPVNVLATPEEIAEVEEPVVVEEVPVAVAEEPVVVEEVPVVVAEVPVVVEEVPVVVAEVPVVVAEVPVVVEKRYILRHAEPKPPELEVPVETIEVLKEEPDELSVGSYYVQLAAFKELASAEQQITFIKLDYPKFIYYDKLKSIYKIMVGPLRNDEKGAALYNARNSGFKDAFVKEGE